MTSSVFLGIFFVFGNISAYISLESQFNADQTFLGNYGLKMYPFCEEKTMLAQIVSKHVLDENATSSAKRAREIGLNKFYYFINGWLLNGTASLYDNITKNSLPLCRFKNTVVTSKSKESIPNLEADRRLYANLFVTCKARDGNLDNAFVCCLNDIVKPSLPPPNVEVQIIDAAAFVNINKTKTLETFGQYYSEEIPWKVQQQLAI